MVNRNAVANAPGRASFVGDGREIDEPHPLRVGRCFTVGDLDGQARLAAATDPGQSHQAVRSEQLAHLGHRFLPAYQRRPWGGQRDNASCGRA